MVKVGDWVRYNDLASLIRGDKGEVIELIPAPPAAGNVIVCWTPRPTSVLPVNNRCRECDFNLVVIKGVN